MRQPPVSVIIPAWNLWELTHDCLQSLAAHTPSGAMEVIVVDNGSTDATATQLEPLGAALFGERFRAIRLAQNLGFAPACNRGAQQATGTRLLFLNNDTQVTGGWLAPLLRAFEDEPRLGAVGPLLLYPDSGRVQHCGIAFTPSLRTEHLYANFPATHRVVTAPRPLQAITGAALMLARPLFATCGGFHEGYRNGCEDLELCSRIREEGYKLACAPQSRVYHLESRTPGRRDNDTDNATLLNERCSGCFSPDLHRHALRDGFAVAVTPWLETFITLQPEQEQELTRSHASAFDPARCWETLQHEPLWQAGYDFLATFFEQAGSHAEAAGLRLLQTYFFPALPHYRALAKAAAHSGNISLADQAVAKAGQVNRLMEDPETLIRKARGLARWGKRAGEPAVEALYAGWLRDLGLPLEGDLPEGAI